MLITEEMIAEAKDRAANGRPEAVGYRVMVKSLFVDTGMSLSMQEQFPTLAQDGFQERTEEQAERESKGTNYGLVVSAGGFAFGGSHLGPDKWVDEGDVAIFQKYAGVAVNIPEGTDNEFRFMNDESIVGRMVKED